MRVPVSWLGEFVELPTGLTPADLHASLVKVGLEEEDLHVSEIQGPIVVGQVVEFQDEPQSNGKTIRWCQVDVGDSVRGIVCGAHNFEVGDKVVVTLPGSVLPGPFPISARSTYGHTSDGMIASARELGLGDEHSGILRLVELGLDPAVGSDAIRLLGLDDWAVEVNVTPDRGYELSIRGIAREYSHSTGAKFTDPAFLPVTASGSLALPTFSTDASESAPVPVVLDDKAPIRGRMGCSQFVTRVVRGVDPTRPTPAWMISRLKLAGIRSISLVVDVTNYVMVEMGQPLHGYDLDLVKGKITVRRATKGERITTLDDQDRQLDTEDLLITDDAGPIGIAGVMGGARTENSSKTVNVLVEAATFDPVSIARSARRHRLPSEASRRFERGVDPAVAEAAAERVVQMLVSLAGGSADPNVWKVGEAESRREIALPNGFVNALIGTDFEEAEVAETLQLLGASVRDDAGSIALLVSPPSWRPDLRDKADLAEEVVRIRGYDLIPAVLPTAPPGRGLTRSQRLRRNVAQVLAANGGVEVMSYPFLDQSRLELFTPGVRACELLNPLDGNSKFLRTSLLPGLVEVAQRNLSRGLVDLKLFEVGSVYLPHSESSTAIELPAGNTKPSDSDLKKIYSALPDQPLRIAGLYLGNSVHRQPGLRAIEAGISDALDAVKQVGIAVGANVDVRPTNRVGTHPGRTAEILVGDTPIGFVGELLPSLAVELDLPSRVGVFELDLGKLIEIAPAEVIASPIGTLPAATQDLSLVVPIEVSAGEIRDAVVHGSGELLESISLVDDYRGEGIPEGTKSLTFSLRFRALDRTLTAAEATAAKMAGVASASKLGARLRD
ncbi:MAG: phenylalanine--tRNA ligase subunit beta [Microbacteriaceae bacterium]|nr:phenylalanine--tRNA ligase subunit beta [Cryobacterium sp.]MCC6376658.1 phenylalanine--tRNA ligase subunit beta [Microbacteriaceae bacterium]